MEGSDDLDTTSAISLLKDPGFKKIPALIFAGGEPLLREDLFLLSREAASVVPMLILITNGTLIDSAAADDISSCFKKCLVSIDGTREANDLIRGRGSFDRAAAGVETLLRKKKRPTVIVTCVVNRYNIHTLSDFVEHFKSAGVDAVKFQLNFLKELQPEPCEFEDGISKLIETCRRYPGFVAGGPAFLKSMKSYLEGKLCANCIAGHGAHIVISPSGHISLCCYYPSEIEGLGSLSDLYSMRKSDIRSALSGCAGCFRYDEYVMISLLGEPAWKIKWKTIIDNMNP